MAPNQVCAGCNYTIKTKELLVCSLCTKRFDLLCANVSEKRFNNMNKEQKCAWRCPECVSKLPKQRNTNTPVRQAANPVTSPGSDYTSTVKNDSPSCSNITFRASQQPLRHEAKLTLDNIRDVIKQEMMSIVKLKVTEELNVVKQQL
ncbi:unnamed protein product [Arctia plantaginis]|uniref:PHD-type domain-containing protein n=1 Tax=Arctia plantaginis TaxID=874455 RepID=A0A8S1B3U8_ARCPL|nr:unnamed protein product [Arctia plantaginis]